MAKKPSKTESTGRDSKGQFVAGNQLAKGNHAQESLTKRKLKQCFLNNVSEEDMKDVVLKLVELAKNGDMQAIKELLDRTLGKPLQRVEQDGEIRIYTDEQREDIRKLLAIRILDDDNQKRIA